MAELEQHDLRLLAYTEIHRPGGDPSMFLNLLASAVISQRWEGFTDDSGNKFKGAIDFLTRRYPEGMGLSMDSLEQVQYMRHRDEKGDPATKQRMKALRNEINKMLGIKTTGEENALGEIGQHGGDRKSNLYKENISLKPPSTNYGTSRAYRIEQLNKYDAKHDTDIAQRVIDRKIPSAAAGIREMNRREGIDDPEPEYERIKISKHNPQSIFSTLTKHMPEDVLHELIDMLNEWREDSE